MPKKTPCGKVFLLLTYPLPMYAPSVKLVAAPQGDPSGCIITIGLIDENFWSRMLPAKHLIRDLSVMHNTSFQASCKGSCPLRARHVIVSAKSFPCPK